MPQPNHECALPFLLRRQASKARNHNVIPSNVFAVDTLWTGVPGNYTDPKAPAALAAVRKFVHDGRFVDATSAASGLYGGPTEVYTV
jgi:hypothetical protein